MDVIWFGVSRTMGTSAGLRVRTTDFEHYASVFHPKRHLKLSIHNYAMKCLLSLVGSPVLLGPLGRCRCQRPASEHWPTDEVSAVL